MVILDSGFSRWGGEKQLEVLTKSGQGRTYYSLSIFMFGSDVGGRVSGDSSAFEDQIVRGQGGQWLSFAVRSEPAPGPTA